MMSADPLEQRSVHVAFVTTLGAIEIVVHTQRAPVSSGAFLKFVDDGSFARLGTFYRTVRRGENDHGRPAIDIVQGGVHDPRGLVAACIDHEATSKTGIKHVDGTVSLARGAVGTATGAAFFICIGEHPCLDAGGDRNPDGCGFAAFGHVARGMDVVREIHQGKTAAGTGDAYVAGQMLQTPVRFLSAARIQGQTR